MIKYGCFFYFLLSTSLLLAQRLPDSDNACFLNLGVGPALVSANDAQASPLTYRGLNAAISAGYERYSTSLSSLTFSAGVGSLQNAVSFAGRMQAYQFGLSYQRLYPVLERNVSIALGGAADVWGHVRLNSGYENNLLSYELASSLSLAARFYKSLTIRGRRLWLSYQIALPAMTYLIRPAYSIPYPEKFLRDGVYNFADAGVAGPGLASGSLVSFNRFFKVSSALSLTYFLKDSSNAIRLQYGWDYYSLAAEKRVATARQLLMFSLLINL